MLRTSIAMAAADGNVVALVEPIALYHERDLHVEGDGAWLASYPGPDELLLPGDLGVHGPAVADVVVITYGNGVRMSLRAAARLAEAGVAVRIVDIRWLAPLPVEAILDEVEGTAGVLVADEARATGGGIADAVVASLAESGYPGRVASVRSKDTYVPLGPAADTVLLGEDDIVAGVGRLVERGARIGRARSADRGDVGA